jgi:hypothetical protein
MEKISWLKELVGTENQIEESGIVDMSYGYDRDRLLAQETLQFLLQLKAEFVDATTAFNELKPSPLGRVKVYGIAKTHADFMLFRHGFKMIFSIKNAGVIGIKFNAMPNQAMPVATDLTSLGQNIFDEQLVEAKWGPFDEIVWTYQGQRFKLDHMVRHYITLFLKESLK